MKKLSLFTLLLACCVCFLQAQTYNVTISGQVTDLSNGSPVANYPVDVVLDSSNFLGFSHFNTVMTDVNGNYSEVVAVPGGIQTGTGHTGTRDCTPSGYPMNNFSYSSSASTISNLDFSICVPVGGGCNASFWPGWVFGTTMVNFTDYSTANTSTVTSWAWDFGDGNTSTLQNPSHAYNALGTYNVCLTIGTASGCTSTYCDSVMLNNNINCTASLSASTSPSGVTTFTASGTGTGSIVSYYYDFGDGQQSGGPSSINHTYTANGTYNACVYLMYSDSCMANSCTTVTVTGSSGCQAGYYSYPDSNGAFSIIIVNTSVPFSGATYLWTWGDGTSSTSALPTHQYSGPGTYVVCVTVTTQNPSCTSTYCDSINVINKISAPFSVNVISNGATAVQPQLDAAQVSLYPNPARDYFQVKLDLDQNQDVSLSLTDLSGKLIAQQNAGVLGAGSHQMRVNTQDLPAGLYIARVQVGESVRTLKVMITR